MTASRRAAGTQASGADAWRRGSRLRWSARMVRKREGAVERKAAGRFRLGKRADRRLRFGDAFVRDPLPPPPRASGSVTCVSVRRRQAISDPEHLADHKGHGRPTATAADHKPADGRTAGRPGCRRAAARPLRSRLRNRKNRPRRGARCPVGNPCDRRASEKRTERLTERPTERCTEEATESQRRAWDQTGGATG